MEKVHLHQINTFEYKWLVTAVISPWKSPEGTLCTQAAATTDKYWTNIFEINEPAGFCFSQLVGNFCSIAKGNIEAGKPKNLFLWLHEWTIFFYPECGFRISMLNGVNLLLKMVVATSIVFSFKTLFLCTVWLYATHPVCVASSCAAIFDWGFLIFCIVITAAMVAYDSYPGWGGFATHALAGVCRPPAAGAFIGASHYAILPFPVLCIAL